MAFPTTDILDDFNRADGDLGADWTADIQANGYVKPDVASNQCKADGANAFSNAWWNPGTFGPDCEVYATVPVLPTTEDIRLYARLQGVGTATYDGYQLSLDPAGGFWAICRIDNGTRTVLAFNSPHGFPAGTKIGLKLVGSTISFYADTGSGWTLVSSVVDATYGAAGHVGLQFQNNSVARIDDFGGGTVVPDEAPANTSPPVASGPTRVGEIVSSTQGSWTGNPAPTFAYQWQRDVAGNGVYSNIAGATSSSYILTDADLGCHVRCVVTATNIAGSDSEPSNALGPITEATTIIRRSSARTLGCGEYDVWITARGGRRLIDSVPWTKIEWGRQLDDTSDASLDALVGLDCCRVFAEARPWRHEILIIRDGERVWEGPIMVSSVPPETPKMTARDLTAWWDHRLIHDDHAYAGVDLATIFENLSADAMAPDTTPRLFVTTTPLGVLGDLDVLEAQHKKAGPLLRDLTKNGIDWTTVGRDVLAGGIVVPVTSIGPFLTEHFVEPPTVKLDGAHQANRWIVSGAGGGSQGDPIFGDASDANAANADGLLEDIENVSTIQDDATADAAAQSRVDLTANDVLIVENAVLAATAPFTMDQLIPGALCELQLDTCLPVADYYRLQSIKVTRDADAEVVSLAFQPAGSLSA